MPPPLRRGGSGLLQNPKPGLLPSPKSAGLGPLGPSRVVLSTRQSSPTLRPAASLLLASTPDSHPTLEVDFRAPLAACPVGSHPRRALAAAWLISTADVVAYMDVDLSTDLDALLPLVAPVISHHSDVAIGSRLSTGARVRRGWKRELISRCYNALLRVALGATFTDAQCGFKAIRAETARRLIPQVENRSWFFDTELLVLAQRASLRVAEVPVDWNDDPDSRVRLVPTALEDLRGVWRLMLTQPTRLARFTAVGITSTIAYVLIYLALRDFLPAWTANATALIVTAVANYSREPAV